LKVLNLYAGIGGNRKLWQDVEVTAVELNPQIAKIYQDFFPQDKVIVADAHQYLLEHFEEFEFIWSSPPCPTHSRLNFLLNEKVEQGITPKYPDMTLYQEIILLKSWFEGKFCIENVISYYEPLIRPIEADNHYFWTNFFFSPWKNTTRGIISSSKRGDWFSKRIERIGLDIQKFDIRKDFMKQVINNCVEPELGLHILNESKRDIQPELFRDKPTK
jgi:DNA (cytosine-5)-methyltransferase 1